jgi:poly-gamma-glutamate synthesis protein (capsule biosynthesis protein)
VIANKTRLGIGAAALIAAAILWWQPWSNAPMTVRGTGDVLTIAATGDSLILKAIPSDQGVAKLLQGASVAVTNLEENLLAASRIPKAENPGDVRWPYGTKAIARNLRTLGFTFVSLANNHAIDYGVDGLRQTVQILDLAGLLHAGAGEDLAQAGSPVDVGRAPKRVAMLAVAVSASAESRATSSRGEILGRPGVNPLRYVPDVTVDARTFAILKRLSAKPGDDQLIVSGNTIKKGSQTAVEMVADEGDTKRILDQVRAARTDANVVILMVHGHEPGNGSPEPAEFLKRFARAAIDAGASMVIGQGPHQLRGIEVYKNGVIFYSLGNFAFDFSQIDPRSQDVYESGTDLYRLALGAIADSEPPPVRSMDDAVWWESVIAVGRFDRGVLRSVRLQPIDLGVGLPLTQRGTPRLASAERSREILNRLTDLSREFGTALRIEDGTGVIELAERNR